MSSKLKILSFILFNTIFAINASLDLEGIENKYLSCISVPDVHDIIEEYVFDSDHAKSLIKDAKCNDLKEHVEFLRRLSSKQKSEFQFFSRLEFLNTELCPNIFEILTKISRDNRFKLGAYLTFICYNGMYFVKKIWAPIACPVNLYLNNQYCTSNNTYNEQYLQSQENLCTLSFIASLPLLGLTIKKYLDIKSIGNFLRNCPKNLTNYFSRKRIYSFCSGL